jgi:hypothetical protein
MDNIYRFFCGRWGRRSQCVVLLGAVAIVVCGCSFSEHRSPERVLREYTHAVREREYGRIEDVVAPEWRRSVSDMLRAHREFAMSSRLLRADLDNCFGADKSEAFNKGFYQPFEAMLSEVLLWPQWDNQANIERGHRPTEYIVVVYDSMPTRLVIEKVNSQWFIGFDDVVVDMRATARQYSGFYGLLTRAVNEIRKGIADGRVTSHNVDDILAGQRIPPPSD